MALRGTVSSTFSCRLFLVGFPEEFLIRREMKFLKEISFRSCYDFRDVLQTRGISTITNM